QIEQNSADSRMRMKNRGEQHSMGATDIDHPLSIRKVHDVDELYRYHLSEVAHRRAERARVLGMFSVPLPQLHSERRLAHRLPRLARIHKFPPGLPVRRVGFCNR